MRSRSHLVTYLLCLAPCVAEAYIGPGAGISAIGSFLALLGGVVLAIVGFVWFPLKRRFFPKKVDDEATPNADKSDPVSKTSASTDTTGRAPGG